MTQERIVPQDQEIRSRVAASTGRSLLVEAAAGTGKTTLVVDRILSGIRDGSLRMPGTVAITFTEKAAGELEDRIRRALEEALRQQDLPGPQRTNLRKARSELDRATIGTIHSFCSGLLREKPAEAGVDPQFEIVQGPAADILLSDCWRRWMDGQVAAGPDPLVEALRAGIKMGQMESMARTLAANPEIAESPGFDLPTPAAEPAELLERLRELAPQVHAVIAEHVGQRDNAHLRALRDAATRICNATAGDGGTLRRQAYVLATVDPQQALKSVLKAGKEQAAPLFDRFIGAATNLGAHLAHDVFHWLSGFVRHYQQTKRGRSVMDFQDLLICAARLLRHDPGVRRYYQQRFEAFFVDEFQDTDPLQAEIIAYLCEDSGAGPADDMLDVELKDGKLVAVGDPKQSIYRFRGADVQVYDRFKDLFGDGGVEVIRCNFRSRHGLLEWFNKFYRPIFQPDARPGVFQAGFVPLEPPRPAARPPQPHVLALCAPEGAQREKAPLARHTEANYIGCMVRRMVEGALQVPGHKTTPRYGGFAMLLRSLTDATIYEDGLDRYGVPYRVIGGKHFYSREQIVETLAVLRAVDDPLDERAVVGALRSSYFGISDEELMRHRMEGGRWNYLQPAATEGPVVEAMALLAQWHARRNLRPPHRLLQEILDETRTREAFLLKPSGEQRVANIEKMVAQVRELGKAVPTFGAVVRHLDTVRNRELSEDESAAMEPGDDFVRIMSMHKSKGLEFDTVILPDLLRSHDLKRKSDNLLCDRLGRRLALRVSKGIESPNYEALRECETANQQAELARLFYVACTRAERLLVLPMHFYEKPPGDSFHALVAESGLVAGPDNVPYGEAQHGVFYPDTPSWTEASAGGPRPKAQPADESPADALLARREEWLQTHRKTVQRASRGRRIVRPSSVDSGHRPELLPEESSEARGGRDVGSLFHELMRDLPADAERAAALLPGLTNLMAGEMGVDEEDAGEAARLARRALGNSRLQQLLTADSKREVPFSVPLNRLGLGCNADGLMEGSIDLLTHRGGAALVLDYKTDRVADGAEAALAERYWPQLGLYALAARACGLCEAVPRLALFFVRTGNLLERTLDDELRNQIGTRLTLGPK